MGITSAVAADYCDDAVYGTTQPAQGGTGCYIVCQGGLRVWCPFAPYTATTNAFSCDEKHLVCPAHVKLAYYDQKNITCLCNEASSQKTVPTQRILAPSSTVIQTVNSNNSWERMYSAWLYSVHWLFYASSSRRPPSATLQMLAGEFAPSEVVLCMHGTRSHAASASRVNLPLLHPAASSLTPEERFIIAGGRAGSVQVGPCAKR